MTAAKATIRSASGVSSSQRPSMKTRSVTQRAMKGEARVEPAATVISRNSPTSCFQ